jgi:hypothetical protein
MGRQLPLLSMPQDERDLLGFIHGRSPTRVFQSIAESPESLRIDEAALGTPADQVWRWIRNDGRREASSPA